MCIGGVGVWGAQAPDPAKAEALRLAMQWGSETSVENIVRAAVEFEKYLRDRTTA